MITEPARIQTDLLRLDIRLSPAGVLTETLCLRELLAFRELDPDWRQHGSPVADVGAREGSFLAGAEGWPVGPIAGDYVFEAGHHSVTERASSKPGVCSRAFRTSPGTGSSTVTAIAAREPGSPRPTAMLPMLMPCSPRMLPSLPIIPGLSSLRMNSMCFSGTTSKSNPIAPTRRGCILGPKRVPLTAFSPMLSSTRLV